MFQITTTFNHNTELLTDSIHPFFFGIESCTQNHSYGPRTRDYILIHFVLAGSGFVTYNDEIPFKVTAHEAFIIPANISCHYIANQSSPWSYCWVAFYAPSSLLTNFQSTSSFPYHYTKINSVEIRNIILNILRLHSSFVPYLDSSGEFATEKLHLATDSDVSFFFEMSSALFKILAVLSAPCRFTDSYNIKRVSEIKQYLDLYYNKSLRIQDIAREFSLPPNYINTIFKNEFGISLKKYIIQKRIHVACELLYTSNLSIKEIAYTVGYENQLDFSQIFRKNVGCSPSTYRCNKHTTAL